MYGHPTFFYAYGDTPYMGHYPLDTLQFVVADVGRMEVEFCRPMVVGWGRALVDQRRSIWTSNNKPHFTTTIIIKNIFSLSIYKIFFYKSTGIKKK
jgi:hypothetical protein